MADDTCSSCEESERSARSADAAGTCQVCFGGQLLPSGRLALHGYKRPGYGEIEGRCPGSGHLPYELSCEETKKWEKQAERQLAQVRERLAELETSPPETMEYVPYGWPKQQEPPPLALRKGDVLDESTLRRYKLTPVYVSGQKGPVGYIAPYAGAISYDTLLEQRKNQLRGVERRMEAAHHEYHEKVVDWRLRPVRPILRAGSSEAKTYQKRSEESALKLRELDTKLALTEKLLRNADEVYRQYESLSLQPGYIEAAVTDPKNADLIARPGWAEGERAYAQKLREQVKRLAEEQGVASSPDPKKALYAKVRALREERKRLQEERKLEKENRPKRPAGLAATKWEWPRQVLIEGRRYRFVGASISGFRGRASGFRANYVEEGVEGARPRMVFRARETNALLSGGKEVVPEG